MYLQKKFTRFKHDTIVWLSSPSLKQFYRQVLYMGTFLSVSVYGWVRLMFHDFPFEIVEETMLIFRILFTGYFLVALCIGGFNLLASVADNNRALRRKSKLHMISFFHLCSELLNVRPEHTKKSTVTKMLIWKREWH